MMTSLMLAPDSFVLNSRAFRAHDRFIMLAVEQHRSAPLGVSSSAAHASHVPLSSSLPLESPPHSPSSSVRTAGAAQRDAPSPIVRQQSHANARPSDAIPIGTDMSGAAQVCRDLGNSALAAGDLVDAMHHWREGLAHSASTSPPRVLLANRCVLNALAGFYSRALPDARTLAGDNVLVHFQAVFEHSRKLVHLCAFNRNAPSQVRKFLTEAVVLLHQGARSSENK